MKSWKTRAWESDDFLVCIATLSASFWLTLLGQIFVVACAGSYLGHDWFG
jgi:uncharacterized membrane protein